MKKMNIFSVVQNIFRSVLVLLFFFFCGFSYAVAENHYETLGISQNATQEEIKRAWQQLAMKYHPDRPSGGDAKKFLKVRESYEVLSDPHKRVHYDAYIRTQQSETFEESMRSTETAPKEERVIFNRDLGNLFLREARPVEIQTMPLENPYEVLKLERMATDVQINRKYNSIDTQLRRDLYKQFRQISRLPKDSGKKASLEQKIDQIIRELQRLYSAHQVLSNSVLREQWDREGRIDLRGTFLSFRDVRTGLPVHYFERYDGKLYDIISSEDGKRIHLIHRWSEAPPASGSDKHSTDVLRFDTTLKYAGDSFENMKDIENVAELEVKESKVSKLLNRYKEILRNRVASVFNRMENMRPKRNLPVVSVSAGGQVPSSSRTSQLPVRPVEAGSAFRASPSQLLTWETLDRMLHPYSENSTHQLKFTEAMRNLPPTMLTFYAAMGAFMFSRTYWDSSTYDGVEIDPEWEQSIVSAVSSPLGLFSFAAFVIVAGQMTRGLEVFINKVVIARSAKNFMNFRGSILTSDNVETSKRRYAKTDRATKRAVQAIRALRLPLSLSAGMMASMAIVELQNDPNATVCWNGVVAPEKRDYEFISACDRFYQEWNSFIEFLIVTPMTAGALLGVNKWAPQNKRVMARGIIVILWLAMMTFEVNGWTEIELENWGKLREWSPMMASMIAAGFALEGLRFSFNKIKKIYDVIQARRTVPDPEPSRQVGNTNSRLSQTHRPELGDLSKESRSSSLSKFVKNTSKKVFFAGKNFFSALKFLGGYVSMVIHISTFLFLDYIFHPFIAEGMKTNQIGKDLLYKKNQINSYINGPWNGQDSSFDFWESEPGPKCSMSDPKNMSVTELAGEVAFNSNRNDCPGRFLAHQLNDYSSLFYDWRGNQLGKFLELYGTWYRDSSPLTFWYNTNFNVLTSMGILPENLEEHSSELRVKQINNGWTGTQYHNLIWEWGQNLLLYIYYIENPLYYINEEIEKIYYDLWMSEQERTENIEDTTRYILFLYEKDHLTGEARQAFISSHRDEINNWAERRMYTTLFLIEEGMDRNQITDEILFEVFENRMEDVERFKEKKAQEVFHEYYSERVQSKVMEVEVRERYLNSPYKLFKSAVEDIDEYIASRRNRSEFRLNKDILSDIYDNNYLRRSAILFPEEELVGSLRALFNAVDFNESIHNYYNRSQVEQCEIDANCNESVLRARAVSAGIDILNQVSATKAYSTSRSLYEGEGPGYWQLIINIREFFTEVLGGEPPRTYSAPFQFNVFNQEIEKEKESIRQGKGWFAPLMDGLPAHPMQYIVYQMVCGPDLNSYFPSMEQTCTDQDDLNQLVKELPSVDKAFVNTSYMFNMPKIIKGDNIPSDLCEKSPYKAFETSVSVGNKKYRNLLEYVLDSENIRTDIYDFWEEKVESQYALLTSCFEDLYGKIYNNHFADSVHSEEVYVVNDYISSIAPSPYALAYHAHSEGIVSSSIVPSPYLAYHVNSEGIVSSSVGTDEFPKGVLASLMSQTQFLFDLLKRVHDYDDKSLGDRASTVNSLWGNLEGARDLLPHICEEPIDEDSISLKDKVYMSIDCAEKLVMDLFRSFSEQIKIEQCGGSLQSKFINMLTDSFKFIQEDILKYLVLQDLELDSSLDFTRSDCFSSISSAWCDMYVLRPRDTATILIAGHHLNKVFEELKTLYIQVTIFSGHVEQAEECNNVQKTENIPLIQELMVEAMEP